MKKEKWKKGKKHIEKVKSLKRKTNLTYRKKIVSEVSIIRT